MFYHVKIACYQDDKSGGGRGNIRLREGGVCGGGDERVTSQK